MGLSSHQSARMKTDEWLTPPEIIQKLGKFDLDPCCPRAMPWPTATVMYSSDGLTKPWLGRVWLNPPFGREAEKWLAKLVTHGNGIALVPARTETKAWFDHVWPAAWAVLFVKGRPHFHHVDGTRAKFNSGAPIALVAYSPRDATWLNGSGLGHCAVIR